MDLGWEIAHTTNMAHISIPKNDGISSVHGSLGTPTSDFNWRTTSRRFETTWATVKKPPTQVLGRPTVATPTPQRFWPWFLGPPAEHVLASVVIQLFWHGVMMGVWHAWCFLLVGFLLFVRLIGWKGWRCVVSVACRKQ